MDKIRNLTKEDFKIIRKALDLYLRCKSGQLAEAVDVYALEVALKGSKKQDGGFRELAQSAFIRKEGALFQERIVKSIGSKFPDTSVPLDDPIRQLIIQMDLRSCVHSGELQKCKAYIEEQCSAPNTEWCSRRLPKE